MSAPPLILACCRCGKRLPQRRDVYVLDDEWARRYPQMTGRIACYACSLGTEWLCRVNNAGRLSRGGEFVKGHVPSAFVDAPRDFDSWSHISSAHTLIAAARAYPEAAMLQGGEPYIRWLLLRWGGGSPADPAAALRAMQKEWTR